MGAMASHVALLRGINVGGRNKVPMAELREVVAALGHTGVTTYIQSGNVLFTTADTDTAKLAAALEAAIEDRFGLWSSGGGAGRTPARRRAGPRAAARGVRDRGPPAGRTRPHRGRRQGRRGQGQPGHRPPGRPGAVPAHAGRVREERTGAEPDADHDPAI